MQLELNNNDVYYVAPEFHTPDELNDAYVNRNVFDRSAFFSPLGIGILPDDEYHYVVFKIGSPRAYFCSQAPKKREIKFYTSEGFLYEVVPELERRRKRINEEFFDTTVDRIIGALKETKTDVRIIDRYRKDQVSLYDKAQFTAYLTRTYFDTEFFIVGSKEK